MPKYYQNKNPHQTSITLNKVEECKNENGEIDRKVINRELHYLGRVNDRDDKDFMNSIRIHIECGNLVEITNQVLTERSEAGLVNIKDFEEIKQKQIKKIADLEKELKSVRERNSELEEILREKEASLKGYQQFTYNKMDEVLNIDDEDLQSKTQDDLFKIAKNLNIEDIHHKNSKETLISKIKTYKENAR